MIADDVTYAKVIVDVASFKVDKPFDYMIPQSAKGLIVPGAKVIVPFGRRKVAGYVVSLSDQTIIEGNNLKYIHDVVKDAPIIPQDLMNLAFWMAKTYICPIVECIKAILPKGVEGSGLKRYIRLSGEKELKYYQISQQKIDILDYITANFGSCDFEVAKTHFALTYSMKPAVFSKHLQELVKLEVISIEAELDKAKVRPKYVKGLAPTKEIDILLKADEIEKRRPSQAAFLRSLSRFLKEASQEQAIAMAPVLKDSKASASAVKSLIEAGILNEVELRVERDPFFDVKQDKEVEYELTEEQRVAVDVVISSMDEGLEDVFLVHGVTGSGKTEIYLRILEHSLQMGKKGILLVPDIALTPQMVDRVKARFGAKVAILHSALGQGERYDQWMRAINGECDIVVGVRSAVFAPVGNLGVIIVDEEHDSSYKQSDSPRYNAREVALRRAEESGAVVVLGSATPCVETYYKAQTGEYKLVELLKRVDDRKMPDIHVVDMRKELKTGNRSLFSRKLTEEIWDRLEKKEQIILFINRRGYSTFVMCRDCGHVINCPNCDVSLVYHAKDKEMTCHYCDHKEDVPKECPECGSGKVKYFGAGTERVEEEVKKVFGDVNTLRMDLDTTRKKGSHRRILEDFKAKRADILIGTQMIAKGLDIPNITLVGVVAADTALNLPDFRSAERTFQIISQVSGRSGRGTSAGEVVVQTYNPDHYGIVCACTNDYKRFYNYEMESRTERGYPPVCDIIRILLTSEDLDLLKSSAQQIKRVISGNKYDEERPLSELEDVIDAMSKRPPDGTLGIVGPTPAPIPKIDRKHRWHLILKSTSPEVLYDAVRKIENSMEIKPEEVHLSIYFDPQSIL